MKTFFKAFFGAIAGVILLLIIAFSMISSMVEEEPIIPDSGFLVININGGIPDFANSSELRAAFKGEPVSVYGIYEALYKAAADERVKGVLFKGGLTSMPIAAIQEIRAAIKRFKESSGKPVYFFAEYLFNHSLYFATACDSIFVIPEAVVTLKGLSLASTHFRKGLDKIGVEADFIAIGDYKSYPESYTRKNMSKNSREVYNQILDYFWNEFLTRLGEKAGKSTPQVEADIAAGIFDAISARDNGYVDGLIYRDELLKLIGEDNELISYSNYSKVSRKSLNLYKGNTLALIFASGSISTGGDSNDPIMGSSMGSRRVSADIRKAADDKTVKAIVFRIDSPGGLVNASDIIWRELKQAGTKKPVIISVASLCASGGYFLATAGDSIISHPASLVGSIGVFAGKFVTKDLFEDKLGITSDRLERGSHADLFSSSAKFNPMERKLLKSSMTRFYGRFVDKVAEARGKSHEEIESVAQGRVWVGEKNIDTGLVDSFGSISDAFTAALEKAGLDPEKPYKWKVLPGPKDFFTELQSQTGFIFSSPYELLTKGLRRWTEKPMIIARMPYNFEVE